jgi:hypothetical protein
VALLFAYVGPVKGYFDQRSELRAQQEHLAALETERGELIEQIAAADSAEVLQVRARAQGLVLPGEKAFAIRGDLDPAPPAPPEDDGRGGIIDRLADLF